METYTDIIFRTAVVFIFILSAIRLFGKKQMSQLEITDLVLIFLFSNAVQNAMVGSDTTLVGGLVSAGTLFLMNFILKRIKISSPAISKLLDGNEVMLIYKGNLITENLKKEGITVDEIEAVIREHGVDKIEHVELSVLEKNGSISVVTADLKGQTVHRRKKKI